MDHFNSPNECYEFLDLTDVDDCVKSALASTLYTPATAGAGGAGGYKGTGGRKQHRTKRRQSNASSVMSSSDGSGVYEYIPYETRRYHPSYHQHCQTVTTFPNPVAPEYYHHPRPHSYNSQQFPHKGTTVTNVDGSGAFGRSTASSKRTGSARAWAYQAGAGRNPHHYNYHHNYHHQYSYDNHHQQQQHQQQQQLQQQQSPWSPVVVASDPITAATITTTTSSTTTTTTSSYTLPSNSVNTNLESSYAEYGDSEQHLSCSAHSSSSSSSSSTNSSSSSYRAGRTFTSRTAKKIATSTPGGTSTVTSATSTTATMPPHTNNPHYQSQQQHQQQQQPQTQQQPQQGQSPQSQQVQSGNAPPNGHNVAVSVSRGSGEQQSVVASAHQQMYPSQPISAGYMAGGPPGNAMYPVPVVPQALPGNVYVSNLTANVNVHGYMPHAVPQYMTTTGTLPAPSGAYIAGEIPSGHEMQVMTPRGDGRGGMRRNGRSNRIGHNVRPRGAYVPHHIAQHQAVMQQTQPGGIHQQQQQSGQQGQSQVSQPGVQQSQQQQPQSQNQNQQNQPSQPPQQHTPDIVQHSLSMEHPQMMSPAPPYGAYSGGYYVLPQFFPHVSQGHHPSAQHAAGAPIFQVPMYPTPMYTAYPPGVVFQSMYQDYSIYDDKGDEHNPQQPPEEGVMHPGMWQPPTMLEYNPDVEYIPQEDDGSMMQQGQPPMQPMTHVLDPNVPNFTMGPITPIQTEDYESMTPAPSEEYNVINNNAMMSPAANLISSPSSNASSQNNLNQNDMYLVPQPPQHEPQHHHQLQQQQQQQQQQPQQQQQQQQQPSHVPLMEMPQEPIIQHEQQQSPMVDHENNFIIEQPPQPQYSQPMSPPPSQQPHIHAQEVAPPMENNYNPEIPPAQAQIHEQIPIPTQTIVQDTIPTPTQQPAPIPLAVATVISPTQIPVPLPITITHVPPPQLNKPPPPIPIEFLNLDKQQQQQQLQQHQTLANDNNNNPKKKTNEVASVATPATVAIEKTFETSTSSNKPQHQQHHQSQVFVNSNKNQTTNDEVARLTKAVQDKFVFKDDRRNGPYRGSNTWANSGSQPPATTISSFTSSTTTVVQHNSTQPKKTTASVSVSAIPNKEFPISSSNLSGPSVASSTKPYQKNTSPVPFTTLGTTSAPPSMHKQPLVPQKSFSSSTDHHSTPVNPGPIMESKKVEAIPQRDIPINTPLPPPGPPPLLSVPPPQPPYTQGPITYAPPPTAAPVAAAPAAKSWASLFNSSSSSSGSTPPSSSIIQPVATPAPIAAGPALPTPSPFAPSFIPSLQRGSQSSATSTQSIDTPPTSVAMKKPVAKVLPFDKNSSGGPTTTSAMSYSAASAQGLPSAGHATSSISTSASTTGASVGSKINKNSAAAQAQAAAAAAKPEQLDENTLKLGEFLSAYQIENNSISILPRGLINRSNYCYINAILQALVACPPFYHLMRAIRSLPAARNSKHQKPFIDAMTALVAEFSTLPLRSKVQRDKSKKDETPEIQCDSPIEPLMIHKMLNLLRSDIFQVEGRQEDAEEFLGCVLNRLNDEMIELMKLSKNESSDVNGDDAANGELHPDDQDDWKVICGNRNKGTVTRTTDFGRSPMSDIFGGKLRSRVHREGDRSTDNIQPFFTLQLDIEKAATVKDALDLLVGKDQLEGVTCSKTKQEIAAWQQVTLEELPIVMILHLKCFDYKMDGCTKILKQLEFPIELKIDSKLMSSKGKSYTAKQKQYKLFAVVYHDGKEASKGHYITDVFHAGYGSWIRYDDSTVKAVSESNVLHPKSPRVPYLLYYRRLDTHYHGSGGSGSAAGGSVSSGSGTTGNTLSTSNSSSGGSSSISSSGGTANYSSSGNSYSATAGGHYGSSK